MSEQPEQTNESGQVLWPNQSEIVEGVVPSAEVSQDPNLFDGDELEDEQ